MDVSLFLPSKPQPQGSVGAKKRLRKCDPHLVQMAWECFWDPDFKEKAYIYRKMQWSTFREVLRRDPVLAPHAKKIAAAFLYIFACFSASNPGVPLFTLIYGIPEGDEHYEDRLSLLKELQKAPRLLKKTCKFLWKDRPETPESLAGFAAYGSLVWKEQLMEAEYKAIKRILSWVKDKNENSASMSDEFLESLKE